MYKIRFLKTLLPLLLTSGYMTAKDGDLDPTFNPGAVDTQAGTKVLNFRTALIPTAESDVANAVAISTFGGSIRIVAAGSTLVTGTVTNFAVARLNNDASPDISLNNPTGPASSNKPGTIVIDVPNGTGIPGISAAAGVAVQPDGKMVVVGRVSKTNDSNFNYFALARLNVDGSMDASFSNATAPSSLSPTPGVIITSIGTTNGLFGVAIQPDGKIVVVGFSMFGGFPDRGFMIAARYNSDGSLDTTGFNAAGSITGIPGVVAVPPFPGSIAEAGLAVALQPDGKIVLVGIVTPAPQQEKFASARLLENGDLDPSFNGTGQRIDGFGLLADVATTVALDSNGNIVIAGFSTLATQPTTITQIAVERLTPLGLLDPSFNKQVITIGLSSQGRSVLVQPWDNKVIVSGSTLNLLTDNDFVAVRLTTAGQADSTFGLAGIKRIDFGGLADIGNASAMQPDRKFVIAGSAFVTLSGVDPLLLGAARLLVNTTDVDSLGITIIDPVDGSSTQNATPPITVVTSQPGATTTIFIDGSPICTTTTNSGGLATCFPSSPLAPGEHTATATATLGSLSAEADPVSFTVLAGGIFVREIFPAPNSTIGSTTPTVVGITNPGNSVTLTIDGVQINGTVIANAQGFFFFPVTTPLEPGFHTKIITVTNADGLSATETAQFNIDPSLCTTPADALTQAIRQKYGS